MPDDQKEAFARSLFARVIKVEEAGENAEGVPGEVPVEVRNSVDSEIRKKMAQERLLRNL